jgi:glucose-1-phosphate thymidylyltransferase
VIPAAGVAHRLGALPCSKELLPLGIQGEGAPRVVSHYLLEQFWEASVTRVFIVLRSGKWDIPAYYGSGAALGLELAYLIAKAPHGVPYTLDSAYAFLREAPVLFGLPDILYPPRACSSLLEAWQEASPDVLLGLFPAIAPARSDMVRLDAAGALKDILVKPTKTTLSSAWGLAAWSPRFSTFLHEWVAAEAEPAAERQLSAVFVDAARAGLEVRGMTLDAPFIDIGTPEGYRQAVLEGIAG